jgi:hypothetical protein
MCYLVQRRSIEAHAEEIFLGREETNLNYIREGT